MSNSKKSVKSKGILAFASNTATTDYIGIAEQTLAVAKKQLGLPCTLITNTEEVSVNRRYDIDTQQFVQWNNFNRYQAYELSPYDETLVIDVDYLILDNKLLDIFKCPWDYVLQRSSHALTTNWDTTMGPQSLPYVWATVFAFRKTPRAEQFFKLVERVQKNYGHYCALFNVRERNYRNDYAFAIADIILNGYTIPTVSIPGSMLTVDQPINSITQSNDQLIVRDSERAYVIPKTSLHIMSKTYLQSENFTALIKELLNEPA
jgi:hypothetical protein